MSFVCGFWFLGVRADCRFWVDCRGFIEAMSHIDIIYIIDKRRWQWLGHVLRMKHDRNTHKALNLLDFEPGSLLPVLP